MLSLIQHVPDTLIVTYNQHKKCLVAGLPDSSHLVCSTKPLTEFSPYTVEIYAQCFSTDSPYPSGCDGLEEAQR